MSNSAHLNTVVNTSSQEKPISLARRSIAPKSSRQGPMQMKDKIATLQQLHCRGFKMMKLFGVNPSPNLKVPHVDKKTGAVIEHRLRCRCRTGQKGESCGSEGKHPIQRNKSGQHGFVADYSPDIAPKMPFCNWAILAGELLPDGRRLAVLDVDIHKGGFESLAACEGKYGPLPPTLTTTTGTGGKHLFFTYPSDWVIESKANHPALGKGFDVKARWGYVVSAGSHHHQGKDYTLDNPDSPIQPLPEQWLLAIGKPESQLPEVAKPLSPEMIEAMASRFREMRGAKSARGLAAWAQAALKGECDAIMAAPSGQGNAQQNKSAWRIGAIVGAGLIQYHDALGALLDAANARGGNSTGSKARKSIESGLNAGRRHPRFPAPKEQKHKDAIDLWFESGGKSKPIEEVITPETFETLNYDPSFWDLQDWYGPDHESMQAEFDATIAREHRLQQADPATYADQEDIESERQASLDYSGTPEVAHRQSASEQVTNWKRRLKRDNAQPSGLHKHDDNIHDCLKQPEITEKDVKHWYRCAKCIAQLRPCEECAAGKLGVIRSYPGSNCCMRGHKQLLQPEAPDQKHILKHVHHKCGWWGCHHCGFDNECDHLAHFCTFGEFLIDTLDEPTLLLPSYNIENLSLAPVKVQPGVWKVLVSDKHSRKFSNKLSKLKNDVRWLADYVGNATYAYYCFLAPEFDPARLCFHITDSTAENSSIEYSPERITFKQFNKEHRHNLSNVGRYISLTKSIWELCDQPNGARSKYNAVNYCRALKMPKRFISSGKYRSLGTIMISDDQREDVCLEHGVDLKDHDPNRIDKSYKRGLTQYLIGLCTYRFPKHVPKKTLEAFIARLLGKDRIVEPVDASPIVRTSPDIQGIMCFSTPLVT